jgi:hypothetical protein
MEHVALRVEDGTIGGDTSGIETVHQLLCEFLVRDDTNGLGIKLLDHLEGKLGQVGLAVLAGIVEYSIWGVMEDLVDKLVTESFPNVGRGPEQADGDSALEDGVSTRANTRTSGDKDHPPEHGNNPQNTINWDATNPQLGWRVVDNVRSPVTSTRDDERELVPGWLGDGCEGMPLLERRVSDADASSGSGSSYKSVGSIQSRPDKREITYRS